MSRRHEWFEMDADKEAARAFFEGSTLLDVRTNWGDDKYQMNPEGQVFVPNGSALSRYHVSEFVGGIAYKLAETGVIPVEEANPNHVANVCFELGKLASERLGELDWVDPFGLVSERIFVED